MSFTSVNPANGQILCTIESWDDSQLESVLQQAAQALSLWSGNSAEQRCLLFTQLAEILLKRKEDLAQLITLEMGKLIREARAEIEKCALGCQYYAEQGAALLADEIIISDAGKSYVSYQALGTVLAVMPWNFPFWQVFRCAVPALAAGNTVLLKHASNVPQCAVAIEKIFTEAGFPPGVMRSVMVDSAKVEQLIADPRIHAVSVTGSVATGRRIAACAGTHLKKVVLELGGSDAFIVLEDADLDDTVQHAVASRFQNAGQSCIAAKRFIVVSKVAADFVTKFTMEIEKLRSGDPQTENTTLAPLARADLRDELHKQVSESIQQGAVATTGCAPLLGVGNYYLPSLLDRVAPGVRAYTEELFGPVASVLRARDEEDALRIANDTSFGLGGSVWTRDSRRGEHLARRMHCGMAFVNGMVKSDPRLPFGGIKHSGYGRELSYLGAHEFTNIKTVWIK